ncbi:MAG: molybdenum cofactor guanylyltransferase [Anaerolineae bacterium]
MAALSAIILSGGQSRRMGRDKALLELDGERLLDRVANTLSRVSDDVIVVAGDATRYSGGAWRVIADAFPGAGALGGLYSGLQAARHPYVLAVACDMPFLNEPLLRYLARAARGWDAAVPQVSDTPLGGDIALAPRHTAKDRDLQPLHAVYNRRVARVVLERIAAGDLRMISFFPNIRVRYVSAAEVERYDPDRLSFFNANTPEEWSAAQERLHVRSQA